MNDKYDVRNILVWNIFGHPREFWEKKSQKRLMRNNYLSNVCVRNEQYFDNKAGLEFIFFEIIFLAIKWRRKLTDTARFFTSITKSLKRLSMIFVQFDNLRGGFCVLI